MLAKIIDWFEKDPLESRRIGTIIIRARDGVITNEELKYRGRPYKIGNVPIMDEAYRMLRRTVDDMISSEMPQISERLTVRHEGFGAYSFSFSRAVVSR